MLGRFWDVLLELVMKLFEGTWDFKEPYIGIRPSSNGGTSMPEDRYPKQPFSQKWNIKPHRGKQCMKTWGRVVDDLALGIDKTKCLQELGGEIVHSFIYG